MEEIKIWYLNHADKQDSDDFGKYSHAKLNVVPSETVV